MIQRTVTVVFSADGFYMRCRAFRILYNLFSPNPLPEGRHSIRRKRDKMKTFIDANPGLYSRFTHYVEFPDYTPEELAAMFRWRARKNQYVLSADVEKWLDGFVRMRMRTAKRDRTFGNGRWARTLFEDAVANQAVRVSKIGNPTTDQLKTLTMKDVGIKLKDPDASAED